ncbi:hypothetical protein F4604DRAFT_1684569 [Suillus subluteus]|nr:hypothetical protein F4604DRAFT_1684569 [Suillus subluteus]
MHHQLSKPFHSRRVKSGMLQQMRHAKMINGYLLKIMFLLLLRLIQIRNSRLLQGRPRPIPESMKAAGCVSAFKLTFGTCIFTGCKFADGDHSECKRLGYFLLNIEVLRTNSSASIESFGVVNPMLDMGNSNITFE